MSGEVESAAQPSSPPAIGRLLAGRYRLQSVLGEGGMAVVYEAENVAIGKRVAIKLVQSLFANDGEIVSRFEREARSASAVESEHIVHVFDVGADPDLGLFLVMELLKGEDLGHVLARHGRLDPIFSCGLIKQAALGLEKAHSAGIVHRDLKPANVFLVDRDDGTTLVKLVDFGIAKVVREAHNAHLHKGITRRGTAIGTPQYMSPEQAQGLDTVDRRTDVYSLGAVLFEAIAGHPYMEERATYEQTILQLISTPAPRLHTVVPDVPAALDDLVAEMLEHDLDRRVPDMRTVRERLSSIYPELQGASVRLKSLRAHSAISLERHAAAAASATATAPTPPGSSAVVPVRPTQRRRRPVAWVAAGAAFLGLAIGLLAMWPMSRTPAEASPPATPLAAATAQPTVAPSAAAPSATASVQATPEPVPESPAAASAPSAVQSSRPSAPSVPTRRQGAATKPVDQVGAAGISSQF